MTVLSSLAWRNLCTFLQVGSRPWAVGGWDWVALLWHWAGCRSTRSSWPGLPGCLEGSGTRQFLYLDLFFWGLFARLQNKFDFGLTFPGDAHWPVV